jgi:hypothetical protein
MDEARTTEKYREDVVKETTPDDLVQVPDGNHTQGRVNTPISICVTEYCYC